MDARLLATRYEQPGGLRGARLGPERALTCAQQVLERHGSEPSRDTPTLVRLRNCPFHPLAAKAPSWSAASTTRSWPGSSTASTPRPSRPP
ncbi:hypothetical protein [Nonomuraea sp. NPDC049758]|uniref:hypothetical protein n=1 Tax=Nonomuraea sp. NPDC049758 TaxID=3154360 RepID=UPI00343A9D9A